MSGPVVVILGAGQGTRMRSKTPKLLHAICGRPMVGWVVAAARAAQASRIVVVDSPERPLRAALEADIVTAIQEQPLGTGDALKAAQAHIEPDDCVVVLYGDLPLLTARTIVELAQAQQGTGAAAAILTAKVDDPRGYGRIVRADDGSVERIVETKEPGDATPEELQIREVNSGLYSFAGSALVPALARLGTNNAQGEYYLTDVVPILRAQGHHVAALPLGNLEETLQVNDRAQLSGVRAVAQRRINDALMLGGATIIDPDHTVIDVAVTLAPDTRVEPGCALRGRTAVGEGSVIGPHSTLIDVKVGVGSSVIHSYATGAEIGDRVSVGPFAYLRPGTRLREGSKAGTFVEIKNSDVGAGSKVPHLSYIGDATIGEDTNLGASTITANYDGYVKHRTTIGSNVHTHVHTTLVAPVEIGDDAYAGAGSVITKNIPEGALGIARERQRNIEHYADRVRERHAADGAPEQPTASGQPAPPEPQPTASGQPAPPEPQPTASEQPAPPDGHPDDQP